MARVRLPALALALGLACSACASEGSGGTGVSVAPAPAPSPAPASLAGTRWTLVQFQSSDDDIGIIRPTPPATYELDFQEDGTAAMKLDCNRGSGTWTAAGNGQISFGPMAMTRAMCPPGSMDTRIARDMGSVRSYILRDGKLHLALEADAGIYTWAPR